MQHAREKRERAKPMQDDHYLAYQQWPNGERTVLEHLYHSLTQLVDDIYGQEDDGRTFKVFKIDPQHLSIEDVTEDLKQEMVRKANREYDKGHLDLNTLHPLIAEEFENEKIAQDLVEYA